MINKFLLFTIFTTVFYFTEKTSAQNSTNFNSNSNIIFNENGYRNCGTSEYYKLQLEKKPSLKSKREKALNAIQKIISENESNIDSKSNAVRTIPVVVHVVYANATQNISDAQIISQIDVLNKDFRKLNTDVIPAGVQSAFGNLRSDSQIEFCLAKRDPNNQATTGITRTPTTHGTFGLENDIKYTNLGGHDAWDANKYLNIWVGNLTQDLLGYAQFPGEDLETDGVVIRYNSFGTTGAVSSPYNKGRTATHEIGHWLDLYHIWGDEPNCFEDDLVNDTPQQKDQNGGCPSFPQTSQAGGSCSGVAPGAMFMNYMDYTNDACMYMFTNGQSVRMNAALSGPRSGLLTSNGCLPPSTTGGNEGCDTLDNRPANSEAAIYNAGSQPGYMGGHNGYGDIAKVEKFANSQANYQIKGCILKFSRISYTNSSSQFALKIWDANGSGGLPNTVLATKNVNYSSVANDVVAQSNSYIEFDNAIDATNNFYAGVEYSYNGTDTLALYSTTVGNLATGTSKAFEKWSNNTWHNMNTPSASNGWGVDVAFYIFPVLCDKFQSVNDNEIKNNIELFPNPATNEVFINISDIKNTNISLHDVRGNFVANSTTNSGLARIATDNLSKGIYLVVIQNSSFKVVKKLIVE